MKPKIIDESTIQGLRKLQKPGKPDLLKNLIELFFVSTDEYFLHLKKAIDEKDFKTIASISHSLKSSAANLGASELSQTCLELEKIGHGDHPQDQLSLIFSRAQEQYQQALEALRQIEQQTSA